MRLFGMQHYVQLLEASRTAGYRCASFSEPVSDQRTLWLRHDVDNCLVSALRMAQVEHAYGIRSTYLLLLRTDNYNLLSRSSRRLVDQIARLGHDIGLHFSLYEHPDSGSVADLITRDAQLLADVLERPVDVFAFHNPPESVDYTLAVPGLTNAYSPVHFSPEAYLSESNMRWRSDPVQLLLSGRQRRLQILVHPLSYAGELKTDHDVLLYFLKMKLLDLLRYNQGQNRTLWNAPLSLAEALEKMAGGDTQAAEVCRHD